VKYLLTFEVIVVTEELDKLVIILAVCLPFH